MPFGRNGFEDYLVRAGLAKAIAADQAKRQLISRVRPGYDQATGGTGMPADQLARLAAAAQMLAANRAAPAGPGFSRVPQVAPTDPALAILQMQQQVHAQQQAQAAPPLPPPSNPDTYYAAGSMATPPPQRDPRLDALAVVLSGQADPYNSAGYTQAVQHTDNAPIPQTAPPGLPSVSSHQFEGTGIRGASILDQLVNDPVAQQAMTAYRNQQTQAALAPVPQTHTQPSGLPTVAQPDQGGTGMLGSLYQRVEDLLNPRGSTGPQTPNVGGAENTPGQGKDFFEALQEAAATAQQTGFDIMHDAWDLAPPPMQELILKTLNAMDMPRQWNTGNIGRVFYTLATGSFNDLPPWMQAAMLSNPMFAAQIKAIDVFINHSPGFRGNIIDAYQQGGGRGVWEHALISQTNDLPWYIGAPLRAAIDFTVDPLGLPSLLAGGAGLELRGVARAAEQAGEATRTTRGMDVLGRVLGVGEAVQNKPIDLPIEIAGKAADRLGGFLARGERSAAADASRTWHPLDIAVNKSRQAEVTTEEAQRAGASLRGAGIELPPSAPYTEIKIKGRKGYGIGNQGDAGAVRVVENSAGAYEVQAKNAKGQFATIPGATYAKPEDALARGQQAWRDAQPTYKSGLDMTGVEDPEIAPPAADQPRATEPWTPDQVVSSDGAAPAEQPPAPGTVASVKVGKKTRYEATNGAGETRTFDTRARAELWRDGVTERPAATATPSPEQAASPEAVPTPATTTPTETGTPSSSGITQRQPTVISGTLPDGKRVIYVGHSADQTPVRIVEVAPGQFELQVASRESGGEYSWLTSDTPAIRGIVGNDPNDYISAALVELDAPGRQAGGAVEFPHVTAEADIAKAQEFRDFIQRENDLANGVIEAPRAPSTSATGTFTPPPLQNIGYGTPEWKVSLQKQSKADKEALREARRTGQPFLPDQVGVTEWTPQYNGPRAIDQMYTRMMNEGHTAEWNAFVKDFEPQVRAFRERMAANNLENTASTWQHMNDVIRMETLVDGFAPTYAAHLGGLPELTTTADRGTTLFESVNVVPAEGGFTREGVTADGTHVRDTQVWARQSTAEKHAEKWRTGGKKVSFKKESDEYLIQRAVLQNDAGAREELAARWGTVAKADEMLARIEAAGNRFATYKSRLGEQLPEPSVSQSAPPTSPASQAAPPTQAAQGATGASAGPVEPPDGPLGEAQIFNRQQAMKYDPSTSAGWGAWVAILGDESSAHVTLRQLVESGQSPFPPISPRGLSLSATTTEVLANHGIAGTFPTLHLDVQVGDVPISVEPGAKIGTRDYVITAPDGSVVHETSLSGAIDRAEQLQGATGPQRTNLYRETPGPTSGAAPGLPSASAAPPVDAAAPAEAVPPVDTAASTQTLGPGVAEGPPIPQATGTEIGPPHPQIGPDQEEALQRLIASRAQTDAERTGIPARVDDGSMLGQAYNAGKITQRDYEVMKTPITLKEGQTTVGDIWAKAHLVDHPNDAAAAEKAIRETLQRAGYKDPKEISKIIKGLKQLDRGWMWASREIRANIQYNIATGIRGPVGDQIGDFWQLLVAGRPDVALRTFDPVQMLYWWRQTRGGQTPVLDKVLPEAVKRKIDLFGASTLDKVDLPVPLHLVARYNPRVDIGEGLPMAHRTAGHGRVVGAAGGIFQNKFIHDLRQALDNNRRWSAYMTSFKKELALHRGEFMAMAREEAPRLGMSEAEVVARVRSMGPEFSAADVTRVFGDEDLTRGWKGLLQDTERAAKKEEDRLLFSYEARNIDTVLKRGFFFHYWQTRALALHARSTLSNWPLMTAYYRAWKGMEEEANKRGYPPTIRGYIKFMGSYGGLMGLVSPLALLTPFSMFEEMANRSGEGPAWKEFVKDMTFLSPMVEGAAAAFGVEWGSSTPNVFGIRSITRDAQALVNFGRAHGVGLFGHEMGGGYAKNWEEAAVSGVLNKVADALGKDYRAPQAGAGDMVRMRSMLIERMQADFGPINEWTAAEWEQYHQAEDALTSGATNKYADPVFEEFSNGAVGAATMRGLLPGTTSSYGPLNAARADRNAAFDALDANQPLTPEQQAAMVYVPTTTAGSDRHQELIGLAAQYHDIPGSDWADLWNSIAFGSIPEGQDVVLLDGTRYSSAMIAGLTDDQRKALADKVIADYGGAPFLEQTRAAQKSFKEQNPEYQNYSDYQGLVRDYDKEHGDGAFAAQAVKEYAAFARAAEGSQDLTAFAMSPAGYLAINGARTSVYDEPPPGGATMEGDQFHQFVATGGASGGTGGAGGTKEKQPKGWITADDIYTDIATFKEDQATYDARLKAAGWDAGTGNPYYSQAAANRFGDPPKPTAKLSRYLDWLDANPGGTVEQYVEWHNGFITKKAA